MPYENVLSPLTLKGLTLKNRVVRTAHGTHLGQTKLNDDLIYYHEARARGGVGLTILEAAGVHPSGPLTLHSFDDSIIEAYKRLMDAVAPHGMAVFQQFQHLGSESAPVGGGAPWSASPNMSQSLQVPCHEMTKSDIRELIDAFVAASLRAQKGGLHGVELHCAHGYLLQQFLSPLTNHRDDEYGGSFENRLRFTAETLSAMRQSLGGDFIIGARFGTEVAEGGNTAEDVREIVKHLIAQGLLDYVNVSHGSIYAPHKIMGGMHEPVGYELPASRVTTRSVELPTIVTGRFRTLADADKVIADGDAELVGMTRAHIAEPEIVRKTVEGREREVRPCIACNQRCVGGISAPDGWGRLDCTVNVAIGAERTLADDKIQKVSEKKTILVVGGGPAGMEAARVAALRGHKVTLAERSEQLGGRLTLARQAPHHAAIGDIADWLEAELKRLGVTIELGTTVDSEFVRAQGYESVVLAVGAGEPQPKTDLEANRLLSTEEAIMGRGAAPDEVVIWDEVGAYEGIGVAEALIKRGARVTFLTPFEMFAPLMLTSLAVAPALERLSKGRFELCTRVELIESRPDGLTFSSSGRANADCSFEALTAIYPKAQNQSLADKLSTTGVPVHMAGDAADQGFLPHAIRSGNEAARLV